MVARYSMLFGFLTLTLSYGADPVPLPQYGDIIKPVDMGGPTSTGGTIKKPSLLQLRSTTLRSQSKSFIISPVNPLPASTSVENLLLSTTQQHDLDVAMQESGVAPARDIVQSLASSTSKQTASRLRKNKPPQPALVESLEQKVDHREAMLESLSQLAASGTPQIQQPQQPESALLQTTSTTMAFQSGCHTVAIPNCFGGKLYSASLMVEGISSVDEAKAGIKQVFELLPMAFSMLGDSGLKTKIANKKSTIEHFLCSAIAPPCSATCQPRKACTNECVDVQTTVLDDDIRGQLAMVGPEGNFRPMVESMVQGPALLILDYTLGVLEDATCMSRNAFDTDATTCLDVSTYQTMECRAAQEAPKAAQSATPKTPAAPAAPTAPTTPTSDATTDATADGTKKATLVVQEMTNTVEPTTTETTTETQRVVGGIIGVKVEQAKGEIEKFMPIIEDEILKQEESLQDKLTVAENSLVTNVTVTTPDMNVQKIVKKNKEEHFVLNETYKLKMFDEAYSACENHKEHAKIASLFSALAGAVGDQVKYDVLIRLNQECQELDHPTPPKLFVKKEPVKNVTVNVTKPVVVKPKPVEPSPALPVPEQTIEEQVDAIEHEIQKRSKILKPYNSHDDEWIQNILSSHPNGDGGHRVKYTREQYRWIHHAKAGSAAVRQFAQMEPRYTKEQAAAMLNGELPELSNQTNMSVVVKALKDMGRMYVGSSTDTAVGGGNVTATRHTDDRE